MGVTRNVPSEGGAGGRLGHSNMEHWDYTGDIKKAARAARRRADRAEIEERLTQMGETDSPPQAIDGDVARG